MSFRGREMVLITPAGMSIDWSRKGSGVFLNMDGYKAEAAALLIAQGSLWAA